MTQHSRRAISQLGCVVAALALAAPADAQSKESAATPSQTKTSAIRELADGYRVSRRLFVRARPSNDTLLFDYWLDAEAKHSLAADLENGSTFVTNDRRGLVVMLEFLNPLRHTWTTAVQTRDDPTYTSAGKFLEAITTFASAGTGIGGVAASTPSALVQAMSGLQHAQSSDGRTGAQVDFQTVRSPALVPYIVWLQTEEVATCTKADQATFQAFSKALIAADEALFTAAGSPDGSASARPANDFALLLKETGEVLYKPTTMSEMQAAWNSALTNASTLEGENRKARNALDAINAPTAAFARSISTQSLPANPYFCKSFATFSHATVVNFAQEAASILAGREKAVTALNALNEQLKGTLSRTEGDYFFVSRVAAPDGKISDVSLAVKRRDRAATPQDPFASVERKTSTATFRVRPEQSVALEFALGVVALGNIEYAKFGTATVGGQTVVGPAGADRQYSTPVALLNLVGMFRRAPISPMLQFGVGSGKNYPMLLAGVGVRFTRFAEEFSLTGGFAFPFVRRLQELKVGDPVSGTADLEKDLKIGLGRRGFYLGIQRSL